MRITFTMLWMSLAIVCSGQHISLDAQAVASGFVKDDQGISVDWTLGVSFAQAVQNNHHLTEGFQQGNLLPSSQVHPDTAGMRQSAQDMTSESNPLNDFQFTVYPNPTTDILKLKIGAIDTAQILQILLLNDEGRVLSEQSFIPHTPQEVEIKSVTNLPPGIYSLLISNQQMNLQSIRFIKI